MGVVANYLSLRLTSRPPTTWRVSRGENQVYGRSRRRVLGSFARVSHCSPNTNGMHAAVPCRRLVGIIVLLPRTLRSATNFRTRTRHHHRRRRRCAQCAFLRTRSCPCHDDNGCGGRAVAVGTDGVASRGKFELFISDTASTGSNIEGRT